MWVLMKVKICCLLCLGNHEAQVSFVSKQKLLLTFSCVLCFLWVLNLNFPFFLTCSSPTHINSVYLISLIEDTSIFRFVYSTFPPSLESRIIWCHWPKKLHWTLRYRWECKFIFDNQLAFFFKYLKPFLKEKNLIMHKRNSLKINSLGIKLKKGKDVNDPF